MEVVATLWHLANELFLGANNAELIDTDATALIITHLIDLFLLWHLRVFKGLQLATDVSLDTILSLLALFLGQLGWTSSHRIDLIAMLIDLMLLELELASHLIKALLTRHLSPMTGHPDTDDNT